MQKVPQALSCWLSAKRMYYNDQNYAHIIEQQQESQLFVATSFVCKNSESWLVENCCTNHMTSDEKLFRGLDRSIKSIVRIINVEYL